MSKTLKWIYQLGYKHAENKLYHQLHKMVDRPTDLEMFGYEDKSEYTKDQLQKRQEVAHRMHSLIDEVFKPNTALTIEQIEMNRFEL